jgi:hypothetical protein
MQPAHRELAETAGQAEVEVVLVILLVAQAAVVLWTQVVMVALEQTQPEAQAVRILVVVEAVLLTHQVLAETAAPALLSWSILYQTKLYLRSKALHNGQFLLVWRVLITWSLLEAVVVAVQL